MRNRQSIMIIFGLVLILMAVVVADAIGQLPVADANGPYEENESAVVTFDASGSYDLDGSIVSYEWDLDDDGEYDDATGVNVTHFYSDNYFGYIGLRVSDEAGNTDIDTASVTIYNIPPDVYAGPDATINEGDTFTIAGSLTDPGEDEWTAEVEYGDGSSAQPLIISGKSFTLSHVYVSDGVYTVKVTVEDGDGGVGVDTLEVTVVDDDNEIPEIPEFPTFTIPIAAIIALAFFFQRRRD